MIKLSKIRLLPFSSKKQTVENRSQHSLVAVRCERILLLPILNLTCVSWIKYMSTPIGAKQYQLKNFFSKKSTADADLRLQARLTLKARQWLIFGERKYYTFFVQHAQIYTWIWKRALMSVKPTIFFGWATKIEFMGVYQSLTSVMSVLGYLAIRWWFFKSEILRSGFWWFFGIFVGFYPCLTINMTV